MPRTTRTFIALPLPDPVRAKLARLRQALAPEVPSARWVGPDEYHLTLAFLGDVDEIDLNAVCTAASESVRGIPRFDLEVRGLGAFPDPARPRVLWAGVVGDLGALEATRKAVADAATRAGYRPADERFHPHVTLAHLKAGRGPATDLGPILLHYRRWNGGSFAAESVVTYASTLTPDGPIYAPLGRAPLAPKDRA